MISKRCELFSKFLNVLSKKTKTTKAEYTV
jgi:hypothetical protein